MLSNLAGAPRGGLPETVDHPSDQSAIVPGGCPATFHWVGVPAELV